MSVPDDRAPRRPVSGPPAAVLFDRDGTLVHDVAYNGDPDKVDPVATARPALERLRRAGIPVGVVSNQSGVARGLLTPAAVAAVNARLDELVGPIDVWAWCPHGEADGCGCRKPAPGLVLEAAERLGVDPADCAVVGDIAADLGAARAAGARGVLVPTSATRAEEVADAELVAGDLLEALDLLGVPPAPGTAGPARGTSAEPASPSHENVPPAPETAGPARGTSAEPASPWRDKRARILAVRLDSDGDVLLAGPAVRALAARGDEVVAVVGPRGRQAAALLPGVARVVVWHCGWVDGDAPPVTPRTVADAVAELAALAADEAVVFTSFHQSPLPTALVLRLAGVRRITAASVDFPGGLLDVRARPGDPARDPTADLPDDLPEPERALAIAARGGHRPGPDDDGCLHVTTPSGTSDAARELLATHGLAAGARYVVLHPGASVPARAWPPARCAAGVAALRAAGHRVVVTGAPAETALTAAVAGGDGIDLGGATSFAVLAEVLRGADAVVVGNTGPAHLAAAVGTPVVSLFAPVVPPVRWAPFGVPHVLLGDQDAPCRGTRARECPVPGHPCLTDVPPEAVVAAVARLTGHGE